MVNKGLHSDLSIKNRPAKGAGAKIMEKQNFKSVLQADIWKNATKKLPVVVYDIENEKPIILDLATLPHLLIGGSTGTGKYTFISTIIAGLTSCYSKDKLQFILSDFKIVKLAPLFHALPHLMMPIAVEPTEAVTNLLEAERIMHKRYRQLAETGARNIADYHRKQLSGMPYLIIIMATFEDIAYVDPKTKITDVLAHIAEFGCAVGIHLIMSANGIRRDVLDCVPLAQIPARIAFCLLERSSQLLIGSDLATTLHCRGGDMLYRDHVGTIHHFSGYDLPEDDLNEILALHHSS